MPESVIVFSSHSLFAEGVVSGLRQNPKSGEVQFIDRKEEDYIQKVAELNPSVVIIDYAEEEDSQCCMLCDLLSRFPTITVVLLNVQDKDVQIISSSTFLVDNVQDLIDLFGGQNFRS